ncbi:MAG TPA: tetratricopeptide repeat protein [Gemmatimonadaceae bacterium]
MASFARIDELKKKFDENPRRYFAPLANEFRKVGEIEQAIMICEEFLPQQPGHMSGHIVYGQALFEAGRFGESRTVFETALTLDPENLIALRHLGDIARGQGDVDSARRWYDRVLEADPRNDEIQELLSSLSGDAGVPSDGAAPSTYEADASAETSSAGAAQPAPAEQRFAPPPPLPLSPPPKPPAHEPLDIEFGDLPAASVPAVPPAAARPTATSLDGLELTSAGGPTAAGVGGRAEGLEPTEFTPPDRPVERDDRLEPGEFSAPATSIAPLPGLEATSASHAAEPPRTSPAELPPLDLDDGLTLPPQGDPVESVGSPTAGLPMLDEGPAASSSATESAQDASPELPSELPPPVIAAEAELIDESRKGVAVEAERAHERERRVTPVAPFLTETMAELYLKQGFREQAYDVYRQLLAANPDNPRLRDKVTELEPGEPRAADTGPNVRDFFARLAARRPGMRSAAATPPTADDFAALAPPPAPPSAPPGSIPSAVERAASIQTPAGSIDALFGSRTVGTSEDSAASALAQAFGGASEPSAPTITGRPARAAAGELSLDSVFRDGSARPPRAQGFSFDQFFSESAAAPPPDAAAAGTDQTPAAEPAAERSADDIEQFNSWLQGLKQR